MPRALRWILIGLGALVGLVVVVLAAALLFIRTDAGHRWLEATLGRSLTSPGQSVTVSGLTGSLPFHWRIARLTEAGPEGPWLTITDARLDIDAGALLRRTLRIENLSAGSIELLRSPPPSPAPKKKPSGNQTISLPRLPLAVELDRLAVGRIDVAPAVAGEAVLLSLDGTASLHAGAGQVRLALERRDGGTGSLRLTADYGPAAGNGPDVLDLDLHAAEPSGVLLATLLPGHDRLPLRVDLGGKGPLARWSGRLDATAGTENSIGADLTLGLEPKQTSASITGAAHVLALLPANLQQALGNDVRFDVAAGMANAGPMALDRAKLSIAAGTASATGQYDPNAKTISANLDAGLDLAPFSALAGKPVSGNARVALTASGSSTRPTAKLTLAGQDIAYGPTSIRTLETEINTAPSGSDQIHVTGGAKLAGILQNGAPPAAGLSDSLDLALDASSTTNGRTVSLTRLTATGAGLDVQASGKLDGSAVSGNAKIAADDLSQFATLAGMPLKGRLALTADAASPDGRSAVVKLEGSAQDLRLGQPVVQAALGPTVTLTASASRDSGGALILNSLKVAGAEVSVDGNGRYEPSGGKLTGHAALDLPRLKNIGKAAGVALSGNLMITADATGDQATVRLTGADLSSGTGRLDRLQGTIVAANQPKRSAKLDLSLSSGRLDANLQADVVELTPDRVSIERFVLTGPGTDARGAAEADLKTHLVSGNFDAHVADLGLWAPLTGEKMAGRADLALKLAPQQGEQADAMFDAAGVATGPGKDAIKAKQLHLAAHLAQVLAEPSGTVDLTAAGVSAAGATIDTAHVAASSTRPGIFNFKVASTGAMGRNKLAVDAGGAIAKDAASQTLTLARLAGHYADVAFRLERPLEASLRGTAVKLSNLALNLGGGTITGSAAYDGRTVSIDIAAAALPIGAFAKLANRPDVSGVLGAKLNVSGPVAAPRGQASLTVAHLQLAPGGAQGAPPPLDIGFSADLQPQTVAFQGRLQGSHGEADLKLAGSVPVMFGASPGIRRNGPLIATLRGNGRLEPLNEIAPLGEDRMGGRYAIDLSVGGTPASPQAGGSLTLSDGSYTNSATGMTLRQLAVELTGNGRQFTLARLTASDGGDGRLSAQGRVDLAGAKGPEFDVSAKLDSFTGARSDIIHAVLSGTAKVGGSLAAPHVDGQLVVNRADVTIPQGLPPSYVKLNVIRIDSKHPVVHTAAPLPPPAPPVAATLDLSIHDGGQTFVRGDGLDSEWKGDLKVTGTSAAPVVTGEIDSINGTFSILGRDFTITRGVVTFEGSTTPLFDIQAQAQTADITATVEFQGTPSQPKLTLSSTPPLPQDEILARVMYGSGVGQISPVQGLELAAAAASLAGGGGPGVLDRLRNATGLDRLSIGQNQSNTQQTSQQSGVASGTTISGGKYVAPGVYVGVAQGVSGGSTRANVQVNVTSHITVNATAGAGGNSGSSLGVEYQLDY